MGQQVTFRNERGRQLPRPYWRVAHARMTAIRTMEIASTIQFWKFAPHKMNCFTSQPSTGFPSSREAIKKSYFCFPGNWGKSAPYRFRFGMRSFKRLRPGPSSTRKYLSANFPSRLWSGPPQLRQVKGRSCVGGASTRTTLYSASQVGHRKLVASVIK